MRSPVSDARAVDTVSITGRVDINGTRNVMSKANAPSGPSSKNQVLAAIAIVLTCLAIGGLGGLATASSVGNWYPTLEKPPWNPPNWVFGPVWTTLYVMMALAFWLVWRRSGLTKARAAAVLFGSQLVLNLGWSLLFFGLRLPSLALIEIVILWCVIAATIRAFRSHSRAAALLMLPYLLWVTYATTLNAGIAWLNR